MNHRHTIGAFAGGSGKHLISQGHHQAEFMNGDRGGSQPV
jgi:hypothetical protein